MTQGALFDDTPADVPFGTTLRPYQTPYHVGILTPTERAAALAGARAREARRKADRSDHYAFDAVDERRELERIIAQLDAEAT